MKILLEKGKFQLFFAFLIFISALQLIISPNSWLYALYGQCDSVVFFLEGRAWFDGAIPYVDFSDSKGPFLYFFYGICSLISRYDYIGVYIASCIWYSFALYIVYRIAFLFLQCKEKAVVVAVVFCIFLFFPVWHYEFRAEDLCLPFNLISIYYSCVMLYSYKPTNLNSELDKESIDKFAFWHGFGIGVTFLIKYTFAAMIFMTFFVVLIMIKGSFKTICRTCLVGAFGFLLAVAPFFIYFIYCGASYDFINEYIIKTLVTVGNTKGELGYVHRIISNISLLSSISAFCISVFSVLIFTKSTERNAYFPIIVFVLYYLITIQNGGLNYYYSSCSVFAIFGLVAVVRSFKIKLYYLFPVVFCIVCIMNLSRQYIGDGGVNNFLKKDSYKQEDILKIADLLKKHKENKVLYGSWAWDYYNCVSVDYSFATKYWFVQTGATSEMRESQIRAIKNKLCNVVFVNKFDENMISVLKKSGYRQIYSTHSCSYIYSL